MVIFTFYEILSSSLKIFYYLCCLLGHLPFDYFLTFTLKIYYFLFFIRHLPFLSSSHIYLKKHIIIICLLFFIGCLLFFLLSSHISLRNLLLLLFVSVDLGISFFVFSYQPQNLEKIFTQNMLLNTITTDQILLIKSSNSSPKCPLNFFFLPLFLKSFNLVIIFLTLMTIRQFLPKIYYSY